jgi:peptide chain release factor 1
LPINQNNNFNIDNKDLDIKFQTGRQKAGGQNVNKVCSAVRMTHLPTNIQVFINGRDQNSNKKEALKILTTKVNNFYNEKQNNDYNKNKKNKLLGNNNKIGGRGEKIRTYNFIRCEVIDHKLNVSNNNLKAVLKGDLSFIYKK